MKRTDVVNKIADFFGEICDFTYEERKIEADVLLKQLEDLGMFPPAITILPDSYNRSDGSYGFEVNEWEPE